MNKIPFRSILKYYWEAQTIYSAHSPFIYQFMQKVMGEKSKIEPVLQIEAKRKELLASKTSIPFVEYGAGSSLGGNGAERKVSDVAKNALSGKWQCRILFNLIQHYGLGNILEIGTSLGISTAYLAAANPSAKIVTLEGNPASAEIAKTLLGELDLTNIDVRIGEFGTTLEKAIGDFQRIDMAFLDGNHRKRATIDYYNMAKSKATTKSIFVIDDIYWSEGMHKAWKEILQDDDVAFSVDLFRMGIVFFDQSIMSKQHFKLIPFKYKPWSIGLFG